MWKWAQGAVASVTGAAEPDYGKEAFQSIDSIVKDRNPFSPLTKDDYKWLQPAQSHVETQTFYFQAPPEQGSYYGFAQLIHSNPVNLTYTSQFTFLLHKADDPSFKVWTSTRLYNARVAENGVNFTADGFDIVMNDARDTCTFTSVVSDESQVELVFRSVPVGGFKIGSDGTSRYGTDPEHPWGSMRHIFWPRCSVSGRIVLGDGKRIDLSSAHGLFVMALQGMKPHHAAARWNFLNFQGPTMSVVVMEFVTPVSYGQGRSSIGAVVKDGQILCACVNVGCQHEENAEDDVGWPAPGAIRFSLSGPKASNTTSTDPEVTAEVWGKLEHQVDRVDVLAEIPLFVKRVAAGVMGARPYIYQYNNQLEARVTVDGKTTTEKGWAFSEATFIS